MRDSGLDTWETWVFSLSFLLALAASFFRLRESRTGDFHEFRWLHRTIGILAAGYAAGYALVLTGTISRYHWSRFFVGVSLLAWILVWIYPPILSRKLSREIVDRTAEAITTVIGL